MSTITDAQVEAAQTSLGHEAVYVGAPTVRRALDAAYLASAAKPVAEAVNQKRPPYGLRLQIGKALDRLVCDESTPEQVDRFIATFLEFGLNITATVPGGLEPVIADTDRLKIPRLTAAWGGIANAPEALDEAALKAAKEAMVEATGLSPMWGSSVAWAGARAAVTTYLAAISGDQP